HREIGVADADSDDAHDDFVVSGVFQIELFGRENARGIAHDRGLDSHQRSLFQGVATLVFYVLTTSARRSTVPSDYIPRGRPLRARQSMPFDRVPGESFEVLVDHTDGRRGRSCPRAPPNSVAPHQRQGPGSATGGTLMGAYCLLELIPSHPTRVGEIMNVLWSDYRAVIF